LRRTARAKRAKAAGMSPAALALRSDVVRRGANRRDVSQPDSCTAADSRTNTSSPRLVADFRFRTADSEAEASRAPLSTYEPADLASLDGSSKSTHGNRWYRPLMGNGVTAGRDSSEGKTDGRGHDWIKMGPPLTSQIPERGGIPPSTRWWQTVASWQALSRPIAAGGGGRRPAFTGLATRPYSGDQVEGGAPSAGRRLPLPVNSIARGKRKWATHQIARSQCHQRACSRSQIQLLRGLGRHKLNRRAY
jgi:hypothetical protein